MAIAWSTIAWSSTASASSATAEGAGIGPRLTLADRARVARRLAAMLGALAACLPLYYLWRLLGPSNPWPRRFLAAIARLAGVRVRVIGTPETRGAVLLANHLSWLDIPLLAGASGAAFVAHSGLADHRLFAWLAGMNDTVFVTRHDRRSVAAQANQVRQALSHSRALAIFPEGTTGDGSALLPFKSALLSALDPPPHATRVQPVAIDYGAATREIAWVGDEPGPDNFLKLLARPGPIEATLTFLAPFDPAAAGDRKGIAAEARARLAAALAR